ncbi:MAG: hypothetical protein JWQ11_4924, partial [Rhizobacter sp.]|nr:hypothetical protein [Rhizobacter sp.]
MASSAGIDLMRGRPTPVVGSTEAKLQQRKLDALRRGIHRIADAEALPYGLHMVGLGRAGTAVVEQLLRDAPADMLAVDGSRLTVLNVDIAGESVDSGRLAGLAAHLPPERLQVEAVSLPMPSADDLAHSFSRLPDSLMLEYPLFHS